MSKSGKNIGQEKRDTGKNISPVNARLSHRSADGLHSSATVKTGNQRPFKDTQTAQKGSQMSLTGRKEEKIF